MWRYIITLLVAVFASKQAIAAPMAKDINRVSISSMTTSTICDVWCVMIPIFLFGLLVYIITLLFWFDNAFVWAYNLGVPRKIFHGECG